MKPWLFIAMALSGAVLTGCATSYSPRGPAGGYSDSFRGEGEYIVRFDGNGHSTQSQVEEMAMLRAAELTLSKGYAAFIILSEDTQVERSTAYMPMPSTTTGYVNRTGQFGATTFGGAMIPLALNKPQAMLRIRMIKADVFVPNGISAKDVVAELGAKYKK